MSLRYCASVLRFSSFKCDKQTVICPRYPQLLASSVDIFVSFPPHFDSDGWNVRSRDSLIQPVSILNTKLPIDRLKLQVQQSVVTGIQRSDKETKKARKILGRVESLKKDFYFAI